MAESSINLIKEYGHEKNIKNSVAILQTDEASTDEYATPVESSITLGKKALTVDLTSVKNYAHKSGQNVYLSKDKNIEYRKSVNFDSFAIQAKNNTVLASFAEAALTEEALKSSVIDFISTYLDIGEG